MNILITGGCGFIGVNLIKNLLEQSQNNKIRVLDNLSSGSRENLTSASELFETAQNKFRDENENTLEFIVGDVRDASLAKTVCNGMDAIVHLAANTGVIPSIDNPLADCMTNVIGTLNYLDAARLNQVKRFLFASSGAPLGEQSPPIHEEIVPRPISPYGASKLAGEGYCSAYYGSFGMDTVVLRFSNVYGPYSVYKGSVVANFIKNVLNGNPINIYGDGKQTRDFIYIDDLVQAILLALECPNIGGEVFQIATQKEHSVREVANELNALALQFIDRNFLVHFRKERRGEVFRNFSDISKARKILGFEPKYFLNSGLKNTFLWFLENFRKS